MTDPSDPSDPVHTGSGAGAEVDDAPPGPRVPRLPPVFGRGALRRLAAEFVIIVVGVLVALAVDDWQAYREQQAEARRLLEIMEVDIRESVADLREAVTSATVRQSAVVELLGRIGEPLPPAEEWIPLDQAPVESLTGTATGALPAPGPDAPLRVLLRIILYAQVFDARTVAFDEFRSTGALASLPPATRGEIAAFYGRMLDFAESNQFVREQGRSLESALESAGVAGADWLPEEEILGRLRNDPRALASLRRAYMWAASQRRELPLAARMFEEEGLAVVGAARAGM